MLYLFSDLFGSTEGHQILNIKAGKNTQPVTFLFFRDQSAYFTKKTLGAARTPMRFS